MGDKWYYVDKGERKGPVELSGLQDLIKNGELKNEDFIWKKGMENWAKLSDVPEVELPAGVATEDSIDEFPEIISQDYELLKLAGSENSIFIKIGTDRGVGSSTEYGPYSLDIIKKLFNENRINAKTFVFLRGMNDWMMLADFKDYSEIFEGIPPVIEEQERRSNKRKPFVARMFFENNKEVYLGICRDVSIGGMQVLVDQAPAAIGSHISINVHPENTDHHFVADGEVVRHLEGGQGFSFRFVELRPEAKQAIEKYITHAQK